MAKKVRYEPDIKGLNKVMRGKPMEAGMRHQAQVGKQYAEAIADGIYAAGQARGDRPTGEYKESFRVSSTSSGGRRHDRAAGYLYNDSDHALLVEVVDDHRVLGTVVDIIEQGGL